MTSRSLKTLLLILLAAVFFLGQAQGPLPHVTFNSFGGIIDNDPNAVPVGNCLDMSNFDVIQTGRQDMSIRQRLGFRALGNGNPPAGGVFLYGDTSGVALTAAYL